MSTDTNHEPLKLSDTITVTILSQSRSYYLLLEREFSFRGGHNSDGSTYTKEQEYSDYLDNYDSRNGAEFSIKVCSDGVEHEFWMVFETEEDNGVTYNGFECHSDNRRAFCDIFSGDDDSAARYTKLNDFLCSNID